MHAEIGSPNLCQCGCGAVVRWDKWRGKYNKYINGHNYATGGKGNTRIITEEHRLNIGNAKRGVPLFKLRGVPRPESVREKISIGHKGKLSGLTGELARGWKGGKTPDYRLRGNTKHRLWREAVFARDNWTCQSCGERGLFLNAHHIKEFAKYKELRTSVENGITLCTKCHKLTHGWNIKQEEK